MECRAARRCARPSMRLKAERRFWKASRFFSRQNLLQFLHRSNRKFSFRSQCFKKQMSNTAFSCLMEREDEGIFSQLGAPELDTYHLPSLREDPMSVQSANPLPKFG